MAEITPTLNLIFTIITSLLSILALVSLYRGKLAHNNGNVLSKIPKDSFEINGKLYWFLLFTAIAVGVFIRIWKFGEIPAGVNQDGAMAAVDGKALAEYGTDRFGTPFPAHLYAWGYGQMSSLLSYLIAVFVKIFGFNIFSLRLPQLIMSLIGGMFLYLFVKDNFGKKIALLAVFIVAVNPWHFVQSRWAVECNLLPHFFIGGLYFLSKGLLKKQRYIYISMIFFGLCMYCYGLALYTIPFFLVTAAVYYVVKKRISIKTILISLLIYLAVAWPFILTMMINFFKWDTISLPFVTMQYFPESIRSQDILIFSDNIFSQLLINFEYLFNVTIMQSNDAIQNGIEHFGTMYYFMIPFVLAGIIGFPRIESKGNKSLVILALCTGIFVGLFTNRVNVNRINIIFYTMMIFAALGVYIVITEIKYTKWVLYVIFAVGAVVMTCTYFTSYAEHIAYDFYDGFGKALVSAENSGADKLYISSDIQYDNTPANSEIVTMFYDKTDAKYFQGKTNINNGKVCLPYKERFTFEHIDQNTAQKGQGQNAAFVIRSNEMRYFDSNVYNIVEYGRFCSVTKK